MAKKPLRIVGFSKHWEPSRIPIPRFIDAWTTNENDGLTENTIPVILDSICENAVVWRTENTSDREKSELHVQQGEIISVCRLFVKSGPGRENDTLEPQDGNADDIYNEM